MSVLGSKTLESSVRVTHAEGPGVAKVRPEIDDKAQRNEVAILFVFRNFNESQSSHSKDIDQGTDHEKEINN